MAPNPGPDCCAGGVGRTDALPDLLRPGLDLVFVGINPGLHSARSGHYFAFPRNRFWPAANAAGLFDPPLTPETDSLALEQGIGFTDIVKRASGSAASLRTSDFRQGAPLLKDRLLLAAPLIVCFNGMTACGNFMRFADGVRAPATALGRQEWRIGDSLVFVAPNPSPANAVYSLEDLTRWYRRLAEIRDATVRVPGV